MDVDGVKRAQGQRILEKAEDIGGQIAWDAWKCEFESSRPWGLGPGWSKFIRERAKERLCGSRRRPEVIRDFFCVPNGGRGLRRVCRATEEWSPPELVAAVKKRETQGQGPNCQGASPVTGRTPDKRGIHGILEHWKFPRHHQTEHRLTERGRRILRARANGT